MNKEELMAKKEKLERELKETNEGIYSFEENEKKRIYGNKFGCDSCKYSAVMYVDEYNLCGASCSLHGTNGCGKYEPDNEITRTIKQLKSYRGEYGKVYNGHIWSEDYNGLKLLVGDIFNPNLKKEKEKKIIDILKILYEVKE